MTNWQPFGGTKSVAQAKKMEVKYGENYEQGGKPC